MAPGTPASDNGRTVPSSPGGRFHPALLQRGRWQALAPLLYPRRFWIALALTLGVAAAALSAVEPLFYKYLLDALVHGASASGARAREWRAGVLALAGLGAALAAQRLLQVAQSLTVNRVRFDSSFELSGLVLERLYARPLSYHQQCGAGYLLTRIDRGVAALGQVVGEVLQSLAPNTINLLLMMALLWRLSPRLAWVGLAPMPLFLCATVHGAGTLAGHEEVVQEGWSRLYSRVTEVLSGIKTVKSMGGEALEVAEYQRQARLIFRRLWRLVFADAGYNEAKGALALLGRLGVAGYGFWLVTRGAITPGTWIAATSYAALLYGPLDGLASTYSGVARQMAAAAVVLDFLAEPAPGEQASVPAPPQRWKQLGHPWRGAVSFEQVSYAYPPPSGTLNTTPCWAIDGVSFHIEAGETIAVIGPSGGGKTTLMDLLLRFHDPEAGRILIDGLDLRTLSASQLRRQMAVVLQEPLLLQGSIADNIAYGCAHASTRQIHAAIEAAQAAEFIGRLPRGLETRLGEGGARLSGGEKQRLAIARALLRDPRILILDEATAHLDAASEAALNTALRRLIRNRTAIVISHRLASMLTPDRIFVIGEGRLIEQGAPEALLASGGFYARHHQPLPPALETVLA